MKPALLLRCAAGCVVWPLFAIAHEGHVHAEAPGSRSDDIGGVIRISEQGKKNLGIAVAEAQIVDIEQTLEAVAEIVPIPDRMAVVASRIPGTVKRIYATAGESIAQGDPLVEIESFQTGDPPPTVSYSAPLTGIVTHWDAAIGESVEPNGHLAEIIDLSQVLVEITLFEGHINSVESGQPVRVSIESFPGDVFEGKITLISGKLDPDTRSLKAYVKLDNPGGRLRPHMRGFGQIVIDRLDTVIGIPHQAITGDPGNISVFVQTDDEGLEYEERRIVLGVEDDRFVEVIEGVLPSESVVVSGNHQLQFVENKSALPPGGGHGHDHGPDGEHLTHDADSSHAGASGDAEKEDTALDSEHGVVEPIETAQTPWLGLFESPLTISLTVGLLLSLSVNALLFSVKKPTAPAA